VDLFLPSSGVNFMEKKLSIKGQEVSFQIFDLGGVLISLVNRNHFSAIHLYPGAKEFVNMLPMVCTDAHAILYMFDLTNEQSLVGVKDWYRQAKGFNKVQSLPFFY
jgi:GTP-binding protein of the ras superfamily involved in termination of M-phase